jgi:hypothetical protein
MGLILLLLLVSLLAVTPVTGASDEDSWIELKPMPTARSGLGVAVVDGKIYAIGGCCNGSYLGTNEMYDPETDTWTTKTLMPTPRSSFAIATYQNKIYVIGGYAGNPLSCLKTTEVYDTLTDTWETKSEIPLNGRGSFCANVVNGKIYLIGGMLAPWIYAPLPEATLVYDPKEDSWTKKSPIPTPVYDYISAVVDNKIYIIGGRSTTAIKGLTQIYDPENDTWSKGKAMPLPVCYAGAGVTEGVLAPKRVYIIGGKTSLGPNETYTDTTQIYDPKTDMWTTGASMLTFRRRLDVAVVDDILYVIGGYKGSTYIAVNEVHIYIPVGYSGDFTPPDYVSPIITINTPQNTTYTTSDVNLSFTVNEETSWIGYSLDEQDNVTITENTLNLTDLVNGVHNITIYANDTSENMGTSETFTFTIAKEPEPEIELEFKLELEPIPTTWIIALMIIAAVAVASIPIYYTKIRKKKH